MGVWGGQVERTSDASSQSRSRPGMRLESEEKQGTLPAGSRLREAPQRSFSYRLGFGERHEVHTEEGRHLPSKRKGHRLSSSNHVDRH